MIAAEVAAKNLLEYVQKDKKWSWCCAGNLVKLQNEVKKSRASRHQSRSNGSAAKWPT